MARTLCIRLTKKNKGGHFKSIRDFGVSRVRDIARAWAKNFYVGPFACRVKEGGPTPKKQAGRRRFAEFLH